MVESVIMALTPADAVSLAIEATTHGEIATARGLPAREIRYTTIKIFQPWRIPYELPGRELRQVIGALEALSLVGQTSIPEAITEKVKAFDKYTEDGMFYGAYGARIAGQLPGIVRTIERDQDSRQAVLSIFDSGRDLERSTKDMPCTIAIQFMYRAGLEMRVVMRSNDAWLGLPYDVVQFAALQGAIARALAIPMGVYVHQAGSLHLYEEDLAKAGQVRAFEATQWEDVEYEPLWHGQTIGEISRWAREALIGKRPGPQTMFEAWLRDVTS